MLLKIRNELEISYVKGTVTVMLNKLKHFEQFVNIARYMSTTYKVDFRKNELTFYTLNRFNDSLIITSYLTWLDIRRKDFRNEHLFVSWLESLEGYKSFEYFIDDCLYDSWNFNITENPNNILYTIFELSSMPVPLEIDKEDLYKSEELELMESLENIILDKFALGKFVNVLFELKNNSISTTVASLKLENIVTYYANINDDFSNYLASLLTINIKDLSTTDVYYLYLNFDKKLLVSYLMDNPQNNKYYKYLEWLTTVYQKINNTYVTKIYSISFDCINNKVLDI